MTREEWLNRAAELMRPLFEDRCGIPLPPRFRVSMSLIGPRSGRTIGRCYDSGASADGTFEILIRIDRHDSLEVIAVLAHELAHAAVGLAAGHKAPFARVVRCLGLEGPATATTPGPAFASAVAPILAELGPFPHAPLSYGGPSSGPPKQGTRMHKVICRECGLIARMTSRWIDAVGPVHCPDHGQMAVE